MLRSLNGWFARNLVGCLALALILVAIVGWPVYRTIREMHRAQVVDGAAQGLSSLAASLDAQWYEMERITYLTQSDGKMLPRLLQENAYYALQASQELHRICSASSVIEEVALVYTPRLFSGEEKVYTGSGPMSKRLFFEYVYRYDQWSLTEINQNMSGYTGPFLRPQEWIMVRGTERARYMTYAVPLSRGGRSNMRGVMLFLIGREAFESLVSRANLPGEATLRIMGESAGVLYVRGDAPPDGLETEGLPAQSAVTLGGEAYVLLRHQSPHNAWQYELLVPGQYIGAAVAGGVRSVLLFLALGLVSAVVLSMALTVYLTRPVRSLAAEAKAILPPGTGADERGDEFKLISNTIAQLAQNNVLLRDRVQSQRSALRTHRLRQLLEGKPGVVETLEGKPGVAETFAAVLGEEGIRLDGEQFRVLVFQIDHAAAFGEKLDPATREIARLSLIDTAQQTARERGLVGLGCDFGDAARVALAVNGGSLPDDDVLTFAWLVMEEAARSMRLSLSIGISESVNALSALGGAYAAALDASDRRFMTGEGCIFLAGALPEGAVTPAALAAQEAKCVDLLKKEEFDLCHQALAEYVDSVTRCEGPQQARRAMTMLLLSMRQTTRLLNLPGREARVAEINEWLSARAETVTELQDKIGALLESLAGARETLVAARGARLVGDAMDHMEENLGDASLNIDKLAEQLGVSSGYLSRLFKEQTHTTPMQYLDSLRMRKARALLRDTGLNIAELLSACGYVDKTNFIRKFRRLYGMTPMGYRQSEQRGVPEHDNTEES